MQIRFCDVESLYTLEICEAQLVFPIATKEDPILMIARPIWSDQNKLAETIINPEKEIDKEVN